jgi:hypothetical protein
MTGLRGWEIDGFVVIADVVGDHACDGLRARLDSFVQTGAGSRTLLREPWYRGLACDLRGSEVLADLFAKRGGCGTMYSVPQVVDQQLGGVVAPGLSSPAARQQRN